MKSLSKIVLLIKIILVIVIKRDKISTTMTIPKTIRELFQLQEVFSISWHVLPSGFSFNLNIDAIKYIINNVFRLLPCVHMGNRA